MGFHPGVAFNLFVCCLLCIAAADDESVPDAETKGAGGAGGDKTVSKMIKGMFPNDEV